MAPIAVRTDWRSTSCAACPKATALSTSAVQDMDRVSSTSRGCADNSCTASYEREVTTSGKVVATVEVRLVAETVGSES